MVTGTTNDASSQSATLQWTLNVLSCTATPYPSSLKSQVYTVGSSTLQVSFSSFTYSPSTCTIYSFVYSSTLADGSTLPSLLSLDSSSQTYSIYSSSSTDAGVYSVSLLGSLCILNYLNVSNCTSASVATESWQLTVYSNSPPSFSGSLVD
jgi:hypothetical protein